MSLLARFHRKRQDPEMARRARLRSSGRIGQATVRDASRDTASNLTIVYSYNIDGAEYESSQSIDDQQKQREHDCLPGANITIRYDPHRPGNSVVV